MKYKVLCMGNCNESHTVNADNFFLRSDSIHCSSFAVAVVAVGAVFAVVVVADVTLKLPCTQIKHSQHL